MVIQQPIENPLAELLASADQKRRISRTMLYAIVGAALLHVGGAVYLYNQRVQQTATTDDGPTVTVRTYKLPKVTPPPPTPIKKQPPQHSSVLHPPADVTPVTPTSPVKVTPTQTPAASGPVTTLTAQPATPATPQVSDTPPGPPVISNPRWLSRPSADQLSQYYPDRALRLGKSGAVTLQCVVSIKGTVSGCTAQSETPPDFGFAAAAIKLSRFFRMTPRTEDNRPVEGATVQIRLSFKPA